MTAPRPPAVPDNTADPARDAWLREALRHAPDADVQAPPQVSAAILREARAAVAGTPRAEPGRRDRWSAAWAWLARPIVAAGFATVMVAGFVGLLWTNGPIDPLTVEYAPELRRAEPAPAASSPPPMPEMSTARPDAPTERRVLAQTPRPSAPPQAARTEPAAVAKASPPHDAVAAADRAEAAETTRKDAPSSEADAAGRAAQLAAAPPLRERFADRSADNATAAEASSNRSALQSPAGPAAQSAIAELRRSVPVPALVDPLRNLRTRIGAEPGRWEFQLDAGMRRPASAALLDWLSALERAIVTGPPPTGSAGPVLTLWHDGERAGRIELDAATATLTLADAPQSIPARIAPSALANLQSALAALAR